MLSDKVKITKDTQNLLGVWAIPTPGSAIPNLLDKFVVDLTLLLIFLNIYVNEYLKL